MIPQVMTKSLHNNAGQVEQTDCDGEQQLQQKVLTL